MKDLKSIECCLTCSNFEENHFKELNCFAKGITFENKTNDVCKKCDLYSPSKENRKIYLFEESIDTAEGYLTEGTKDVVRERAKQIINKKYTLEYDKQHKSSELIDAAICLAKGQNVYEREVYPEKTEGSCCESICKSEPSKYSFRKLFPLSFGDFEDKISFNKLENLIKAAALIIAEIDRIKGEK